MAAQPDITKSIQYLDEEPDTVDTVGQQVSAFPTAGLDYTRDIAPLQRRFFSNVSKNPRIRPEVAASMATQFATSTNQIVADRLKMADAEQGLAARKLQYESTLFALDREREKVNRERNMLSSLIPLQNELTTALTDPNTTAEDKQKIIGQIGVRNAGLLAINPAAETAFRSAQLANVKQPKPDLTAANYIQSGGSYKYLKDFETSMGRPITPTDAIPFDVFAKGLEGSRSDVLRTKDLREEQDRKRELEMKRVETLMGLVTKAGIAKNPMTKAEIPNEFDNPMSAAAVNETISIFGNPEEQKASAAMIAKDKLMLAQKIAAEQISGKRAAAASTAAETRSLFTSKPTTATSP